jgi:hypothetical protein
LKDQQKLLKPAGSRSSGTSPHRNIQCVEN